MVHSNVFGPIYILLQMEPISMPGLDVRAARACDRSDSHRGLIGPQDSLAVQNGQVDIKARAVCTIDPLKELAALRQTTQQKQCV